MDYSKTQKASGVISRILDRSGISRAGQEFSSILDDAHLDSRSAAGSDGKLFMDYVHEFSLTPEDLARKHRAIYQRAIIYVFASVLILGLSAYSALAKEAIVVPAVFILVSGLMVVYSARLFFRAWQIRISELAPFDRFLSKSENWF